MSWSTMIMWIWSGFLLIGSVSAVAVFLWAVRNGQFGDQERARSLALLSEIPADDIPGHVEGSKEP